MHVFNVLILNAHAMHLSQSTLWMNMFLKLCLKCLQGLGLLTGETSSSSKWRHPPISYTWLTHHRTINWYVTHVETRGDSVSTSLSGGFLKGTPRSQLPNISKDEQDKHQFKHYHILNSAPLKLLTTRMRIWAQNPERTY